jgi:hypothetical protein
VPKRENPIVNRLNKTKVERVVDHEQEKIDRIKKETAIHRAAAAQKVCFLISLVLWDPSTFLVLLPRKKQTQNSPKLERQRRLPGLMTRCSVERLTKTRIDRERQEENWRRISCSSM